MASKSDLNDDTQVIWMRRASSLRSDLPSAPVISSMAAMIAEVENAHGSKCKEFIDTRYAINGVNRKREDRRFKSDKLADELKDYMDKYFDYIRADVRNTCRQLFMAVKYIDDKKWLKFRTMQYDPTWSGHRNWEGRTDKTAVLAEFKTFITNLGLFLDDVRWM